MDNKQLQHLEYFKVNNFKGLESLELKDIRQFNLILGDNNIGKTSVLEALGIRETPFLHLQTLYFFYATKAAIRKYSASSVDYVRPFIGIGKNEINYFVKTIGWDGITETTVSCIQATELTDEDRKILLELTVLQPDQIPDNLILFTNHNGKKILPYDFSLYKVKNVNDYFPHINTNIAYEDDLVGFFSKTVNLNVSMKRDLISGVKLLQPDIEDIVIDTSTIPDIPTLTVMFANGSHLPLYMLGDGTLRLFRILIELIMCTEKYLMIDEIDNGIHFSKMKKVWEVVLNVAEKQNTQLFITTHNAECLRAFKEVLEEQEMQHLQKKVASYSLFRNKEGMVDNVRYSFAEFEHAIDYSLNIRG